MSIFKNLQKYSPPITTCFFWVLAYPGCIFCAKLFQTETPSIYFFIFPIVVQILAIILMLTKKIKIKTSFLVIFHLIYCSFVCQISIDEKWNTIAYSWGIIFGGALAFCLSTKRFYLIGHFSYFIVGALTFFLNENKIGNDEVSSFPNLIGVFIFYPVFNQYLVFLKVYIGNKNERIKSLVENLEQGFMTMDKNGVIQEGATKITKDFFNINPVDKKLSEVLNLKDEKKEIFNKWMKNIYKGILSFRDLRGLGPQSFELNGRYIDLDYKPIYAEGSKIKIDKVICIATDKSQEIELERKIDLDKQKAEFITTCLQNPSDFIDLLNSTQELLFDYKEILKKKDYEELFRDFHTLKARWGQFGLKSLTKFINDIESSIEDSFEEEIVERIEKFRIKIQEFLKENDLVISAANKFMVEDGKAVEITELLKTIGKYKRNNKNNPSIAINEMIRHFHNNYYLSDIKSKLDRYKATVTELSEKQKKVIDIQILGDEIKINADKYKKFINSLIHIFRNMVDHGIETEDERVEKNKKQRGSIKLDFKKNGDTFIFQMADDGGGIDPKKIKDKVLEKGLKSKEDLQSLKDSDLVDLIFLPGFSTKEEVTDVSGRGVGMDAVKEEVENLGGTISVSSEIDEGTKFTIELPILR